MNASTAFSMVLEPCRSYRIAVACVGAHGPTLTIADAVAARLRIHGHIAVVDDQLPPNPEDYSAVVIGCACQDVPLETLAGYVAGNRAGLSRVATALFLDGATDVDALLDRMYWRPDLVVGFGAAPDRHSAMVRWMLHAVGRQDGHVSPAAIKRFADAVATGLARAASVADLIRAPAC